MIKKVAIVTAAVLVFAIAFFLRASERQAGPETDLSSAKDLPRLVDLGSDKCVPCKRMAPILEKLAQDYRNSFVVEILDVRKNPELGKEWGVRVIPTQIFLDASGEERFRHEGFMGKDAILSKWTELGIELRSSSSATGS